MHGSSRPSDGVLRRAATTGSGRRSALAATRLASLTGLALLVVACAPNRPDPPDEETPDGPAGAWIPDRAEAVEVETILSTQQSGIEGSRRVVIRSQEEWRAFWREVHRDVTPLPEVPTLDFETRMVIAATLGRRNTGGHSIAIDSVLRTDDRLYAVVRSTSPGQDCMVTQALTAPATAVRVPGSEAEVTFVNRESTRAC